MALTGSGHAQDAGANSAPFGSPSPPPQTLSQEILSKLFGPLARDLNAAFSMDGRAEGSIVYTRNLLKAELSDRVEFGLDGGRQAANFRVKGAVLRLNPPLELGAAYTLAAWVKLPPPVSDAAIFQSAGDSILEIKDGKFGCNKQSVHRVYATCDPSVVGWHHLAVTCDGRRMLFYLDGIQRGDHVWTMSTSLKSLGNHANPSNDTAPCGGLDDALIFSRELSGGEVARIMQIRLPASK